MTGVFFTWTTVILDLLSSLANPDRSDAERHRGLSQNSPRCPVGHWELNWPAEVSACPASRLTVVLII